MSDVNIDQAIFEAIDKFKASHDGQVPARLQIKKIHQEKLGNYYNRGGHTILIDYVDGLEDGDVRCIGADVHQAVSYQNKLQSVDDLPDWASKERK